MSSRRVGEHVPGLVAALSGGSGGIVGDAADPASSPSTLAAVTEDDRGDIFYGPGHVPARVFFRAVVAYLLEYDPIGVVVAAVRDSGGRSHVIGRVRHEWRLPGDGWVWGANDDAGVEAWTVVEL